MKLQLADRSNFNNSSFTTKVNEYPYFLKIWHYHPELELVVILKSEGTCFVGDCSEKFQAGEIVLLGENLPHMWLSDEDYFQFNPNLSAKACVMHFKTDYLGSQFFVTPEMQHIYGLFERARNGIKFFNIDKELIKEVTNMLKLKGFDKTLAFLTILNKLSRHRSFKLLASQGFINTYELSENKNLDNIHAYIFKNFYKTITLKEVARIAHMNTSAFSRFFKRVKGTTFTRYVTEIRIGYACKLLLEGESSISTVCYESGFNNISNFNRQFRLIMNCSPSTFLREHKNYDRNFDTR
ncbi:AraC family transcriptional regulator [Arenibacter sp. F26102]|uniref:AraC family transcriptional regulator n=1 Tax=Arenibacter sp. F26102 TaxID=2926416 RepID=UPI001FF66314|nr:AraC family transcriptional regulator [Arenibacter sp. F26102]MCK0146713.1 AraC family transcriptional regulator [Arenibacter sp. F26102]